MRLTLIAVQSLDGFITKHATPGSDFASPADQAHFRAALRHFDCSIFGANTYRVARAQIRDRLGGGRAPEPLAAALSASAQLNSAQPVSAQSTSRSHLRTVVTHTPEVFHEDAVPGQLEFSAASPAALLASLAARGYQRCALLGGAQVHSGFLEAGLINELWLTIEPILFGSGTPLLARPTATRLHLLGQEKLTADTHVLKYEVLP